MRKIACILLAALLLMLSGCGEKTEEPKFINTVCHQEFLKNGVVTGTDDYFYTHNDQGLVTGFQRYQDGLPTEQSRWEYDAWGNLLQAATEGTDTLEVTEYKNTLDEDGHLLHQEAWTNGIRTSLREITYNRHGQEATHHVTSWHKDGELDGSSDYTMTYNWKGELTRQVHLRDRGDEYVLEYQNGLCIRQTGYESETHAVTYYWEYTYDQQDRCTREARYDGNGILELYHEYVYDDAARTKTRTCYHADGTADNHSDVFTYDEYGNAVMQERIMDGEVYWRIQNTYELLETALERS